MIEQWTRWEPLQGLARKYYANFTAETPNKLEMILTASHDVGAPVRVLFEGGIDAYRGTNESFRLLTMSDLSERYGSAFYGDWTFFKVENSLFIKWLLEQSDGLDNREKLLHFSFVAGNSIEDVIATYEPKIEFMP